MARWKQFPNLHVYHYAPYEPAALKRLLGRYATREEEIDSMLRAGAFVDLYQVVRRGVRASVENYSIKTMEPFYGFERETSLPNANVALANLQAGLEFNDIASIAEATKATVLGYNRDDCISTAYLRDWLEELRGRLIAEGTDVPRPLPGNHTPTEKITDWLLKINALIEKLTDGIPVDPDERDGDQHGRWLLANLLDWHRREEKSAWWEFFRLADLSAEDLLDEGAGLSGLTFTGNAGGTAKAPIHRYRFVPQETELRGDEELRHVGGDKLGKVEAISFEDLTVDIKKRQDCADTHPQAVFAHTHVDTQVIADAIVRIGEYVAERGLRGDGPYQAARDLLLRESPRVGGKPIRGDEETAVQAAVRLCSHLAGGILPVQGPPGAGKTVTGAQMICELVRQGKTVGITANSHKVIRNLIDETIRIADERGIEFQCCQKADVVEPEQYRLTFAKCSEDLIAALGQGVSSGRQTSSRSVSRRRSARTGRPKQVSARAFSPCLPTPDDTGRRITTIRWGVALHLLDLSGEVSGVRRRGSDNIPHCCRSVTC